MGGAISLATTATLFLVNQFVENRKRLASKKEQLALDAYFGLTKILLAAEIIENFGRHIDAEFKRAQSEKRMHLETALNVRQLAFAASQIEGLMPSETIFLIKGKQGDPASKCNLLIRRARNHQANLLTYNERHRDYKIFCENNADKAVSSDSIGLILDLAGKDHLVARSKVGIMNFVIGSVIDQIETDRKEFPILIENFVKVAPEEFGDSFPSNGVEWSENANP